MVQVQTIMVKKTTSPVYYSIPAMLCINPETENKLLPHIDCTQRLSTDVPIVNTNKIHPTEKNASDAFHASGNNESGMFAEVTYIAQFSRLSISWNL